VGIIWGFRIQVILAVLVNTFKRNKKMEKIDNSLVDLIVDMSHRIYLAESKCKDYERESSILRHSYEDLYEENLRLKKKLSEFLTELK